MNYNIICPQKEKLKEEKESKIKLPTKYKKHKKEILYFYETFNNDKIKVEVIEKYFYID